MKQLPPDLRNLDADELGVQTRTRDERLEPLFRRWPKLARHEFQELTRLYAERLRIARYVGELRRTRRRSR
jgi:hypothetical protein